ncbi:MAG TPA: protein kinase [Gemmatimonadaceae bacterium]|nr:protein kinase [Gemmatimonadaceae bacterium]
MSSPLKICPQCGTEYPASARFCEIDGTSLRNAAGGTDMVGSIIADRYHVLKKLGEGGMGQVYLVEHVKMGRKSALKVMHPSMKSDVDAISRFNREAANASRIAHPNVAAVYDFGETTDGIIYLAMEFVEGPPLTSVIAQQGALAPKRAAEIVRQSSEALAVAHDMGIVHRDLKPDNIMIAKTRDGGDLVKVVDFGIAKAAGSENQKVTKTGLVVGTPEYMSPEQLAGDKLDGRSDIYSLALVAFNMMTGTLPFPSDSAQESMIMRLTDRPKPLAAMKPDVNWPTDVQAVMDKALERDVGARYQTATDFGRDLFRVIDRMPATQVAEMGTQLMGAAAVPATRVASSADLPLSAPPPTSGGTAAMEPASVAGPSVTYPTAPPKKRNMVPVLAGVAAIVVLGGGAALFMNGRKGGADTSGSKSPAPVQNGTAAIPVGGQRPDSVPARAANPDVGGKSSGNVGAGASAKNPATKSPSSPAGSSGTATPRNVDKTLDQLQNEAEEDSKASGVFGKLAPLWSQMSESQRARGNFIKARASITASDPSDACTYIIDAIAHAPDSLKSRYHDYAEGIPNCKP